MDGGAWWAAVHGVAKSRTRLSDFPFFSFRIKVKASIFKHPYSDTVPKWHNGRESTCQFRRCKRQGFNPWVRKIPWSRKWQPILAFLPRKSHGQRSLVGYSPGGHKESDMTEHKKRRKKDPTTLPRTSHSQHC